MRVIRREPEDALVLPVRDIRVLYGLKGRHYDGFARTQMPQAHEYFCPMDALTAERGDENPAMRALIARASAAANFMHLPAPDPVPVAPAARAAVTRASRGTRAAAPAQEAPAEP